MAIRQYWTVKTEDGVHSLSYTYSFFSGKSVFTIDGESFVQKMRSFRINVARREIFRLGDEQGILVVSGNGRAEVLYRGKPVPEQKTPDAETNEVPERTGVGSGR